MTSAIPKRDACFLDEYYIYRNQLEYKPNFQVSSTFSSTLSVEQIFNALTALLQQYIQWSLQVFPKEGENNKYELRPIQEYKLSDVFEIKTNEEKSFEDFLASLTHSAFELSDDKKPLWRLILYNSKTLVFYADHVLGDGTAYKNFHLELLRLLNNPVSSSNVFKYDGFDSIVYKYSESLVNEVYPAYNSIIDCTVSWGFMVSKVLQVFATPVYNAYFKLKPKNKFEKMLSGDKFITQDPEQDKRLEYHLSILNIPLDKVEKLIHIARTHEVKLTSLLYVICLSAFLPITRDKDISGHVPVNIRKLIDKSKARELCSSFSDKFGLFIGAAEIELPSLNKFQQPEAEQINWEAVQEVHKTIINKADTSYQLLSMLQLINIKKYLIETTEAPRNAFELSNLGSIKQGPDAKFKIVDMVFNQPPGKGGSSFCCNVLGTDVGGINLSLTCTKALDEKVFQTYTDGVKHWIDLVVCEY